MSQRIRYVGLDVCKETIAVAVAEPARLSKHIELHGRILLLLCSSGSSRRGEGKTPIA
jgi:hypothetical protein